MTSHPHALAIEPPSRGPEGGYLKVVTDLPLYEESPGFDLEAVDSLCDWIGDYLAAYYPSIREARIVRVRKSPA